MKRRIEESTQKRRTTLIVTLFSVMVVLVAPALAADEIAGRNVGHVKKVEMIEVGDVPGHFMGVSQSHGMAFYTKGPDNGEIASRTYTTIFDVVEGKGTLQGYETKTFKDGSTLTVKFSAVQTPTDEGRRTAYEGTWEVTGGTGKHSGAKGGGTIKGERIGDPKTGADAYADFTGTIAKQ